MRIATSTAVNAYVELPMTRASARVHATSKTMVAAPETPIVTATSQAPLLARSCSAPGTDVDDGRAAFPRPEPATSSAAAPRFTQAAIQPVARLPSAGRSQ